MATLSPRWVSGFCWLALFFVLASLASPCLEPFLAPLAPSLDFALSFRRHRNLFVRIMDVRANGGGSLQPQALLLEDLNRRTTSDLKRRRARAQTARADAPHRRPSSKEPI